MPATKFVFLNRRPGLLDTFDYRSPYAFDSFAKWILNTLGRDHNRGRPPVESDAPRAEFLGPSAGGPKRRLRD